MSAEVLDALLETSAHVAALVVAALLLERVLAGALSPRTRLALWLVVMARLALPALPEVPREVAPPTTWVTRAVARPSTPGDRAPSSATAPTTPEASTVTDRARRAAEATSPGASSAGAPAGPAPSPRLERGRDVVEEGAGDEALAATPRPAPPAHAPRRVALAPALVAAWLAGVALSLARMALAERALRRALRVAAPAPAPLLALVDDVAARVGLARAPRVALSDALGSPAVHGWRRPTLVLPPSVAALDDDALRCVLAHECAHVRRGDLVLAPLLAVLRAVWWFHPLARLAAARLADALEEARDQDALRMLGAAQCAANASARVHYARVLVRLAETRAGLAAPGAFAMAVPRRGLTRRVHMILAPNPSSLPLRLASVAGVSLLAWLGLVAASPAQDRSGGDAPRGALAARPLQLDTGGGGAAAAPARGLIEVELPSSTPQWILDLEARLDSRLERVHFAETPLPEALLWLGAEAGFAVVLGEEVQQNPMEYWVTLDVSQVTVRDVLDVLCEYGEGLEWTPVEVAGGGALRVDQPYATTHATELRLYKVQDLLSALREAFGPEHASIDDLIDTVRTFATPRTEVWDRENTSLAVWEGLLCVRQTREVHRQVHALLERLAARELAAPPAHEPWRAALEAKLATVVDIEATDTRLSDLIASTLADAGVAVIDPWVEIDQYDDIEQRDFSLRRVTLRDALTQLLAMTELRYTLRAGGIEVRHEDPVEVYLHPLGGLLKDLEPERRAERFDGIDGFLRSTIDASSWDRPDVGYRWLGDLLIVRQTHANQVKVRELLSQLERALAR